jgi:hypothetical protein
LEELTNAITQFTMNNEESEMRAADVIATHA